MEFGDGGRDESPGEEGDGRKPSLSRLVEAVKQRREGGSAWPSQRRATDADDRAHPPASDVPSSFADVPSSFEFPATKGHGAADGHDDVGRDLVDGHAAYYGTDPKTEAIVELVGDASSVLLLGPLLGATDYDLCTSLSTALPGGTDNLLLVTMTESPDERLSLFQGYLDHLPERTVVLNVGDSTRSGSTETVSTGGDGTVTIETISDPTDLMRIGIATSKLLSAWDESGGQTAVCFHSLTALLQYVEDPKVAFRFVHTLLGRIGATGASAHFHMDASAHDSQLVGTFRPIFDEVLTFDEDGSVHVEH